MKRIDEYTLEELMALYKRYGVYATTWWFKYFRMHKLEPEDDEKPFINLYLNKLLWYHRSWSSLALIKKSFSSEENRIHYSYDFLARNYVLDREIEELKNQDAEKNHREILKRQYELEAYRYIQHCKMWFDGEFDIYQKYYEDILEPDAWLSPEELQEELHITDELNIEKGIATDYQVYEFVWETLQYLNIKQLGKLLSFVERGLQNKWENITMTAGRKSRKCEIRQVDIETGETVDTYTTRNELIDKIGISKSHLAQCIKTSKEKPNDRNEWKKWKDKTGKLFGFMEV